MGDLLKEIAKSDENLSKQLKAGTFIDEEETSRYLIDYLSSKKMDDNLLLDGFPRSIGQYDIFKIWLESQNRKIDLVIYLEIDEVETIKRISSRRVDSETGRVYNLVTDTPGPDIDPKNLVQREDDTEEAIRKRLAWTKEFTVPLLATFSREGILLKVNCDRLIDVIFKDITKHLSSLQR